MMQLRRRPATDLMAEIRRSPLFSALDDAQLERLRTRMTRLSLEERQPLFEEGDPAERFFLVMQGKVKLFRISVNGAEKIIEIFGPGKAIAAAVMFMESRTYPVSAQALTPAVLLSFDCKEFMTILRQSPDTCFRLLGELTQRLHQQMSEINNLCVQNATCRLAHYLLQQLPAEQKENNEFTLDAPKHVIASRLSIQPETLSRILAKLRRRGLIDVDNKTIRIPNVKAYKEYLSLCELSE